MKKHLLILLCLIISPVLLFAQKIYFKADAGYAIGIMKYTLTTYSSDIVINHGEIISQTDYYTDHKYSFSQGFAADFTAGIKVFRFFAVEASGFINPGKPLNLEYADNISITNSGYDMAILYYEKVDGKMFGGRISGCFFYPGKKLQPYLRMGIILASLRMKSDLQSDLYNPDPNYIPTENVNYQLEYKPNFNAGFSGGLGLDYMVADNLGLFAEVSMNIISYVPKSARYTEYVINGTDLMPYMTVSEKEMVFVDDYNTQVPDPNEPSPRKSISVDFNNLTIAAGIRFNLFN